MRRDNFGDLLVFLAVAEERRFIRAAAKLGLSPSALSHTTRSVSPTEAGERLRHSVGPRTDEIESELASVGERRDKPAGTIRITTTDFAADIVASKFDIGVRWGDQVAKDMVAVRVGPDMRMGIVGAPAYFESRPAPKAPQELLAQHGCRHPTLARRRTSTSPRCRTGDGCIADADHFIAPVTGEAGRFHRCNAPGFEASDSDPLEDHGDPLADADAHRAQRMTPAAAVPLVDRGDGQIDSRLGTWAMPTPIAPAPTTRTGAPLRLVVTAPQPARARQ